MTKQFSLGKNERLKSRKQIELLFSEGKKISVPPFRIFYLIRSQPSIINLSGALQFGVGVSAKNFKRAVDRNRVKRLVKEAYRLQKNLLKEKVKTTHTQLNVFFIYTSKELPEFSLVKDKIAIALQKLETIINENPSSTS